MNSRLAYWLVFIAVFIAVKALFFIVLHGA